MWSLAYLKNLFSCRLNCYGLVSVDKVVTDMIVFVWVDRNMRYFISTIVYLEEVQAIYRKRWSQVVKDVNSDTHMVYLYIPQPVAVDIYYTTYSAVDWHNKMCDDLKL